MLQLLHVQLLGPTIPLSKLSGINDFGSIAGTCMVLHLNYGTSLLIGHGGKWQAPV